MNILRLGWSSWILILNIVLLILIIYKSNTYNTYDRFKNYAQQVDITNVVKSNPDVNEANENYAQLMYFIQNNPGKSLNFIEDIKNKFFTSSCNVKSNINFNNLVNTSKGVIFS